MRNIERIRPLLNSLEKVWKTQPDLRLGQLISVLASQNKIDIFYLEDEKLLEILKKENPFEISEEKFSKENETQEKSEYDFDMLCDKIDKGEKIFCPACGHELKDDSWHKSEIDSDNELIFYGETIFNCPNCKSGVTDGEWYITDAYKASEKQIRVSKFIAKVTKHPLPPPVKKIMWKYIKNYLNEALETQKQNHEAFMEQWCEENYDLLPDAGDLC